MTVTKLNADALPFHGSNSLLLSPLPPPSTAAYHAAAACPLPTHLVPNYPCASPFPEYSYPLPPPPYGCMGGVPSPLLAPPPPPFLREQVPALPPHGRRPRTLMFPSRGAVVVEKLYAQALAKARAHAAAAAPRSRRPVAPPCEQQQAGMRGRSKEYVPVVARAGLVRSPSPVFTTRPAWPTPSPAWLGRRTTIMIRNIPNRLTRAGMMELLDDHCARANRRRGRGRRAVVAAYDFLYVPMDFSVCSTQRSSNKGYAFVNFTTAAAARGLHGALHGCRWKVLGSKKTIHIDAAHIQGKEALVRHFSRSTFACHSDELLPAVFSPPRDGASEPSPAEPRHVGRRTCHFARCSPGSAAATQCQGAC